MTAWLPMPLCLGMATQREPGYASACATLQQLAGRPSQRWAAASCSAGSWPVVKSCMAAVVVPGGGGQAAGLAAAGAGFAGPRLCRCPAGVRAGQPGAAARAGQTRSGCSPKPGCPCAQGLGQIGLKRLCSVRRVLLFLTNFRRPARCWLQWLGPGHRRLARANALAGHGCAAGFENGCCPPCRAWR